VTGGRARAAALTERVPYVIKKNAWPRTLPRTHIILLILLLLLHAAAAETRGPTVQMSRRHRARSARAKSPVTGLIGRYDD